MERNAGDSPGHLTRDDTVFCVRACAYIRLPAALPNYFREYLAQWADDGRPALADKVRHLTGGELLSLYSYVRDLQLLSR